MSSANSCCSEVKNIYKDHVFSYNSRGAYVTSQRINQLLGCNALNTTTPTKMRVCNTMYKRMVRSESKKSQLTNMNFQKMTNKYQDRSFDIYL